MGLRVDIGRQRVGVGRFQLRDLPPLQDLLRETSCPAPRDRRAHCAEVDHAPVLVLVPPGKAHLAEENVADLLGAADIDRLARESPGSRPRPARRSARIRLIAATAPADRSRCRAVPSAPARHQRPLQRLVDCRHALGDEARLQHAPQPEDDVGVFRGIGGRLVDRDLVEGQLALAAADQFAMGDRAMPEPERRTTCRARARCGRRRARRTSVARRRSCSR